jgi:hypothetical protein
MTQSERFALAHTLSEWPDDATYEGVQQLLEDGDEYVSVWEMMEDWPIADLLEYQDELEQGVRELKNT